MSVKELCTRLAALTRMQRDVFIDDEVDPDWQGLVRVLFAHCPMLPV